MKRQPGNSLWLSFHHTADCTENGVYQTTETLPAGSYTFSAYVRVMTTFTGGETPGA